jgi:TolB-like protein
MKWSKLRFFYLSSALSVMLVVPAVTADAGGKKADGGSEVVVQRVDNNSLIRLRIYIDAKVAGSLKVGETSTYKVTNGPHTIRAAFADYQARSTEVTQFNANNNRIMFTVTDESIVAVGQESISTSPAVMASSDAVSPESFMIGPSVDASVRNSFEGVTKTLKKKTKVAVINVDSAHDNQNDYALADYVLEELTYLTVHSPKKFDVIDRRAVDAFRASNGIGLPSYNNDYILMLIGQLLGADIVLTGRVDGPGELRRLRVKALDVKNGRLVGDASERI